VSQKRLVVESPWSLPANASGLDTHHHGSITIRGGRSVTAQELEETYLPAFKACVMEGNAQQIMCSYNSIAVSGGGGHSYNSTPACLNGDIQNRQMRGEWGFKGSVVSVGAAAPTPFPSDLGCVLRLSECSRWHWCFNRVSGLRRAIGRTLCAQMGAWCWRRWQRQRRRDGVLQGKFTSPLPPQVPDCGTHARYTSLSDIRSGGSRLGGRM
jgi:hypothetical protein